MIVRMPLTTGPIAQTIETLYNRARPTGRSERALSPQERADAGEDFYWPVSPDSGSLIYSLVRAAKPEIVVEFGMSYGISTLFSAAAVRDNGTGHIYTSELSGKKIAAAKQSFEEAGVADIVTILEGDALETLPTVTGSIGFVVLDGWKELYLPVIKLLEPNLVAGALIFADNTNMADATAYLDYVSDADNGYTVTNLNEWTALACRN